MTQLFQFFGGIFITHPYIALLPAVIFGLFYFQSKNSIVLTTSVLWLLYAIYEELHLLRIICSGECNIRIDLLLIYPIIVILSVIALVIGIRDVIKTNSR